MGENHMNAVPAETIKPDALEARVAVIEQLATGLLTEITESKAHREAILVQLEALNEYMGTMAANSGTVSTYASYLINIHGTLEKTYDAIDDIMDCAKQAQKTQKFWKDLAKNMLSGNVPYED